MSDDGLGIDQGFRFEFGTNWSRFLKCLTPERIQAAERSLQRMLQTETLEARRFLDVGSGSGLFSLAARRLGARVHSFDYDPESVACTRELRRVHFPDDPGWTIEEGSVLDQEYLDTLGQHDVVYSWGVLHHTGEMWEALANAVRLVAPRGTLFLAIYNDQGNTSSRWRAIKRLYNKIPSGVRPVYVGAIVGAWQLRYFAGATLRGKPMSFVRDILNYDKENLRGMSYWRDMVDWVGGYPFESARPEEVFRFFHNRGFILKELVTCGGGHGCNEFVFERI